MLCLTVITTAFQTEDSDTFKDIAQSADHFITIRNDPDAATESDEQIERHTENIANLCVYYFTNKICKWSRINFQLMF